MSQFRSRLENEDELPLKENFVSVGIVLDQNIIDKLFSNFGKGLEQHIKSSVGLIYVVDDGDKIEFKQIGPGRGGACRKADLVKNKFILLR